MFAKNLKFEEIEGNPPEFNCNLCGRKFSRGGLAAEIEISADAHITIVVCSALCAVQFKNSPTAEEYILDLIADILKMQSFDS